MTVSIEEIIPGMIPPKDEPEGGVDFRVIYDNFDPATLTDAQLLLFADNAEDLTGGSSYITSGYKPKSGALYADDRNVYPIPMTSAEDRLSFAREDLKKVRSEFKWMAKRYHEYRVDLLCQEQLQHQEQTCHEEAGLYKYAKEALSKAIGMKACVYIIEKELNSLSVSERKKQKEDWQRWYDYSTRG